MSLTEMQTHVAVGLLPALILANVQARVAVAIVAVMILADVQTCIATAIVIAVVMSDMQSRIAVTIAAVMLLTRMKRRMIGIMHVAGSGAWVVIGGLCCGNLIGSCVRRRCIRMECCLRRRNGFCRMQVAA